MKLGSRADGDSTAIAHNPGAALDVAWVRSAQVDEEAVAKRAAQLEQCRDREPRTEAAWLLEAVGCLDLTTLGGDDTPDTVRRLAAKARSPLGHKVRAALGLPSDRLKVASLCVFPSFVPVAREALVGSGVSVSSVAGGFPAGQIPPELKVAEITASIEAGVDEIDVVIRRAHPLTGDWRALFDEVCAFRNACGPRTVKVILATGELGTLDLIARASRVCLLAGADFLKTSTGRERINATLPAGLVMAQAIRDYAALTGHAAGLKPAGGISTTGQALNWMTLVQEELGADWLNAGRFRIGASGVLADIERRLARLTG